MRLLQHGRRERLATVMGQPRATMEDWLNLKLGWLKGFAEDVAAWSELMWLTQQVRQQVRQQGLARESAAQFRAQIRPLLSHGVPVQRLAAQVEAYLENEGQAIPQGMNLVGSSEVIESVFGRFKTYLARSGWQEIGRNILLLPLLLCQWGMSTLAAALQTVSGKAVTAWVEKELGPSQQTKYQQVLGRGMNKTEKEERPPPTAAVAVEESSRSPPEDRKVA